MYYQYDKFLKYGFGNNIENLSVEIDLQKKKKLFSMALTNRIKVKFE